MNMLNNITKNRMGTVSFDGKFANMRKSQDFIVYPMTEATTSARIQSDKRCGLIDLMTGVITLADGAYSWCNAIPVGSLTGEELLMFKAAIFSTASGKARTNGAVYCDNSAALEVFGGVK